MQVLISANDRRQLTLAHCRRGTFLFSRNDVIGQFLAHYGEWAEAELALLCPLLRPGDTVLDIGANIGAHAIPFAAAVGPTGRVHAFEPQPLLHGLLCANAALNDATAIRPHRLAVGESAGELALPEVDWTQPNLASALSLADASPAPAGAEETVPVVRIDEMLSGLKGLRLVKADVEGMELAALRGAEALIRQHRPLVYVEINDHPAGEATLAALRGWGYRCWWHPSPAFNPANFNRQTDNPYEARGDANVLAVPEADAFVPDGLQPATRAAELRQMFPGLLAEGGRWARLKRQLTGR